MGHSERVGRVVRRGAAGGALVAALAGAFTAGALLTGGPGGGPPGGATPPVRLAAGELAPAASCDDLLDSYVRRAVDLVGPWGWGGDLVAPMQDMQRSGAVAADAGAGAAAAPATSRATNGTTGTNVQEAGVDEPDVVKTDGTTLHRIDDDELTTYDVSGGEVTRIGGLDLDGITDAEALLAGDRLVVVGTNLPVRDGHTRLVVVDVADPAAPAVVETRAYDAALVTARLHDGVVRVVLGTGLPELDFVTPDDGRGEASARRANEAVVRATTLDDWLPHAVVVGDDDTVDPATGDLLADCSEVVVPDDGEALLGTTTVVALDPVAGADGEVAAVATEAATTYFSPDRMYLAGALAPADPGWCCLDSVRSWVRPDLAGGGSTALHAFALDGARTSYVASGEVEGAVRDRWAMDSSGGVLRLAVGPTSATDASNSVLTLRERGAELVEAGRLDGLGPGEDIRSVRWFDDLAIVVTFRQVDPLHAVDLSDVDRPRALGELEIPGYSEYLHPLGERRLIGVGQDADLRGSARGAQAALFDVTDLTDPRRLDTVAYPRWSQAGAATDPRQFTWLPDRRTALTVVSEGDSWGPGGRTGWVSVLRLADGRMRNRLLPVEHGTEVAEVRLVPLPSGRVVLVTGDAVSFLDL